MEVFDIPVVLLMFKRDKIVEIIDRIREVKPQKMYLISDGGRTEEEHSIVCRCRTLAENAIDWKCEVIKNYAESNRGVFQNIAGGAKWVFEREQRAIFLEDDNLPEVTFFQFCNEMLEKYKNDPRVLWICGTNYLGQYRSEDDISYFFTRHLLPCGWASWSKKFFDCYEATFEGITDEDTINRIRKLYSSTALYRQSRMYWAEEWKRLQAGKLTISWDMQMDYSVKKHNAYGICPCNNQIKNIGVDEYSIHGGSKITAIMTQRFCGMDSYPMRFPLKHPQSVVINKQFEKALGKVILRPLLLRIQRSINPFVRKHLSIPEGMSTTVFIKTHVLGKR